MCPAPSGGTYEAARGPGKGGEPARVVWVGEPKPAAGLGKTQRAQEAQSPLTADLECALPLQCLQHGDPFTEALRL